MTVMSSQPASASRAWRVLLPWFGGVFLLLLWQYRASFLAMEAIWARSETFAHAYLVPPIVLWLIWRDRHRIWALSPHPQIWALLPMALVAMVWFLGDLAGVNALTQLAATALLVCTAPAMLGWQVARALAFPLAFLFFMVPVGEFVMPQMMEWTADVTVAALRMIGIPVYREGLQFVIPSGSWSVVEACSGVRYLIASFMVGTLFAYLNYSTLRRRLIFVLASLLVPIVANWARAVMIVLLGHYSGNRLAVGVDHLIYGWVFFGLVIGLMFYIGSRWSEVAPAASGESQVSAGAVPGVTLAPASVALRGAVAAAATALLIAPALLTAAMQEAERPPPTLVLPVLAGVSPQIGVEPLHRPHFEGLRAQASANYFAGGHTFSVHVAYYRQQTYGRKLVSSQNVLVPSEDKIWRRTAAATRVVQVNGQDVSMRTAELRSGAMADGRPAATLQARQLYWVAGRWAINDQMTVLWGVLSQITGQGDDAAAITFYGRGGEEEAAALDAFVAECLPQLAAWLNHVKDGG